MNTFNIFKIICDNISDTGCSYETYNYAASLIKALFENDSTLSVKALIALNNDLPAYEGDGITPCNNTEEYYKYLFYLYKSLHNYDVHCIMQVLSDLCR